MNSLTIKVRSLARKLGVIRLIHRLRPVRPYEDRFRDALQQSIRPGDTVWDVGANVGIYTEVFLDWVGPEGHVVAFEPVLDSAESIRRRIPESSRLDIECLALGETSGQVSFVTSEYSVASHMVSDDYIAPEGTHLVGAQLATGDEVAVRLGEVPNVIKIDVEGFEEEVLRGLTNTLASPVLRTVLVEVHFQQLEARGRAEAPLRIEKLLRAKGFHNKWITASQLHADRTPFK